MIDVLLLDDHAVVRAGYRRLIDGETDMRVTAEAATSAHACELARLHGVRVAVVDLHLRGDSGMEAIRLLRGRCPETQVLVVTMHDHESYAVQALRAGATGYLTKDSDPQELLTAIRTVARGQRTFSSAIAQALLADIARQPGDMPLEMLTPREFEVLRLSTQGLPAAEIAGALHISEKTVYNTMSLVRQKLDVRNDFMLLRLAASHGLVQL